MNKKLLAIAVAAFVAAPAIATAQTTLYGQFKYEVGYVEDVNGDNNLVHSNKGTRLGVRGSEDLGGGLEAIYRFQSGMSNVNEGVANATFKLNEENWVGLKGGFGTLQLGRSDTAMKKTAGAFRAFTDTLAEPNAQPARFGRADGIHYTTPNFAGANVYVTVEPNGAETDAYYALGASYNAGPIYLSAAFESFADDNDPYSAGDKAVDNPTPPPATISPNRDQSNYQVGGKWSFGQGDVGVLYQAINDGDDDVILVPVNFKVTPNVNLRAAAKFVDPDGGDDYTNFAIGAQYMISKRTEAFVNIWADDEVGITSNPVVKSGDSTHFGLGLRHSF